MPRSVEHARPASLHAQEEAFLALVTGIRGPLPSRAAESILVATPRLRAEQSLEIHRGLFWARIEECLAVEYPTLAALLGAAAFDQLARRYFIARPSRSVTLEGLGAQLPAHLASEGARHGPAHRGLVAVAELEAAENHALRQPEAPFFDAARLTSIPEARRAEARLVPAEGLVLLEQDHDALGAVRGLRQEGKTRAPAPQPSRVAVVHHDGRARSFEEPLNEFRLLQLLAAGVSFGAALSATPLSPAAVRDALARWMACSVFADLRDDDGAVV